MGIREKIEERIRRKEQEIADWTTKIAEARSYIQGLQEAIKLMPKEGATSSAPELALRPGSSAHHAMEALKASPIPLHINALLKAMGKENTKEQRVLVGGTLSRYARLGQVFSKTGPNTFTLLNKSEESETSDDFESESIPDPFEEEENEEGR
ncbi:hypothetical protein YTPLAS72_26150 [Nitrospira sp.]|nr:hypothetical protein YTPLAS72_26150 [Nitrospira sp.]